MNLIPRVVRSAFNIPTIIGRFRGGTVRVTPRCSLLGGCKYEITVKEGLAGRIDSLGFTESQEKAELMGATISIRYDSSSSLTIGRTWNNPQMLPSIGSKKGKD